MSSSEPPAPIDPPAPPSGGADRRAQVPAIDPPAPPSGGADRRAQVPAIDPPAPPSGGADRRAQVPAIDQPTRSVSAQTAVAETSPDLSTWHDEELPPPGYDLGELLGRGGMGEVLLARDRRIGRNVAVKRLRGATPSHDEVKRFLREAKIQARLDHPAIAPVHELGHDAEGRPYFTMKRLTGVTLHARIVERSTAAAPALPRLLRAFVDVCLAVEFAHERGVVHRDLKPANIMLGNYGEVYILDWGVARVIDPDNGDRRASTSDIGTLPGHTQAGALLGTPGYMAPEQARGEDVGPAADLYSLGAILFEILTRQPLHPRGANAIASTLASPTASPATRHPDCAIAPELDAACVSALTEDPRRRPDARSLAERIQRYLDGDRDLEQRRTIATAQLRLAHDAIATNDPRRRADAIRAAGRALALEPNSEDAAALVGQLMLRPPDDMPPALASHLDDIDRELGARSSHLASFALLAYFAFIPFLVAVGITKPWLVILTYVLIGSQVIYADWMYRKRRPQVIPVLVVNIVTMLCISRLWGPFILLPGIINIVGFTVGAQPKMIDRPVMLVVASLLAFALPIVLEATGVFGTTWQVLDGEIVARSTGVHIGGSSSVALLVGANAALILVSCVFGRSISATRRDAQRQLAIQAWHLRQLLPA